MEGHKLLVEGMTEREKGTRAETAVTTQPMISPGPRSPTTTSRFEWTV
jgi:hypothetical protein